MADSTTMENAIPYVETLEECCVRLQIEWQTWYEANRMNINNIPDSTSPVSEDEPFHLVFFQAQLDLQRQVNSRAALYVNISAELNENLPDSTTGDL